MKNFSVYKSSAGSGKTYTLVKEYLKLSLGNSSPFQFSKILAITFTNKASEEMKMRILHYLREISKKDCEDAGARSIQVELSEELKLSPEELSVRARASLTTILHNYADFSVSTIDTFSHKLIRTFARDLGLSLNFRVEMDLKLLLEEVVANTISQVGLNEELSRIIIAEAQKGVDEGKSWDPSGDLLSLAERLLSDSDLPYLHEISKRSVGELISVQKNCLTWNREFKNQLKELGEKMIHLIKERGVRPKEMANGENGLYGFFNKLKNFNYKGFHSRKSIDSKIEEGKWYSTTASPEGKAAIDSIQSDLAENYALAVQLIEEKMPEYLARKACAAYLGVLSILSQIDREYQRLKVENHLLPISDFNRRIAEVVLSEPMPFIYERLGEKFDHILVDEFQDTSVMQFMNLLPLMEESMSRGKRNLIVGDAKQAIYRFRGGEVAQFSEMPNHVPSEFSNHPLVLDRLEQMKQQYQPEILKFNFRSLERLVSFNNQFFEAAIKNRSDASQSLFFEHKQIPQKEKSGGYVSVQFLKNNKTELIHEQQVLEDIQDSLEDGFAFRDICILCRTRKLSVQMAEFLKEHEIPLLSSESLLLASNSEVQFLIALGQWILNSEAYDDLKDVILYLHQQKRIDLDLEEAFEQFLLQKNDFMPVLKTAGYNFKIQEQRALPLYEFYENLIRRFELNQSFNVYLQFFMEAVYQFSQQESNGSSDFYLWWLDKKEVLSIEVSEEQDAVKIMTLHKSKGLEFPVVILPYVGHRGGNPNTELIWAETLAIDEKLPYSLVAYNEQLGQSMLSTAYDEELEKKQMDQLNEMYVALTRASERMYIRVVPPSASLLKNKDRRMLNSSLGLLFKESKPKDAEEVEEGYFFGKREVKKKASKGSGFEDGLELQYLSENWQEKIRISSDRARRLKEDSPSARDFGNLFHSIMAMIKTKKDIDPVLNEFLYQGEISEQERSSLKTQVEELLRDPICKPLFQEGLKVKLEASMLGPGGSIIRPDRVVFAENEVIVLDYKTGEATEQHLEQIQNYKNFIQSSTDLPVIGYLYYLDDFKAVRV